VRQQIPTLLGLLGRDKWIIDEVRQLAGQALARHTHESLMLRILTPLRPTVLRK
jgi:hypothetical protein